MCCALYDEEMFTQMEWHVLNTLDWIIGHPTVDSFLQIALTEDFEDFEVQHMAWYICEIALYHKEFVSTKPSVMARASLALARGILGRPEVPDGAWGHVENLTLLGLSQHLNQTSSVLSRKYASPHLSRASTALEHFLAQQAAIARRAAPLTPPCESTPPKPSVNIDYVYNTPQKAPYGVMVNGYLTPPETPEEGEFFLNADGTNGCQAEAPRRPVTPSPSGGNPYTLQHQQFQGCHQSLLH
jgi:hypothetical protein